MEIEYTGEALKDGHKDDNGNFIIRPYRVGMRLRDSVNLAMLLGRPLLIKGEPGTGKSRLAESVAFEFGHQQDDGFFRWFIKSTSRAQDGIYSFDALARLRDAQRPRHDGGGERIEDLFNYIDYGPLGKAFMGKNKPELGDLEAGIQPESLGKKFAKPPVVLIDEIDKADIDFPNDLLNELDRKEFQIREIQSTTIKAINTPLVIITSNDEKPLPKAFLRRCIFHWIDFPEKDILLDIVKSNLSIEEGLIDQATSWFLEIREEMKSQRMSGKKPSTSELLDWVEALHFQTEKGNEVIQSLIDRNPLLFPGVLLKDRESLAKWNADIGNQ